MCPLEFDGYSPELSIEGDGVDKHFERVPPTGRFLTISEVANRPDDFRVNPRNTGS
jgi:hypothetical protein